MKILKNIVAGLLLMQGIQFIAGCSQGNRDWEPDRVQPCYIIMQGEAECFECAVSLPYRITIEAASKMSAHGLCWNTTGTPTIEDSHAPGPECPEDGGIIRQYVSAADLAPGTTYYFRAYITVDDETTYSNELTARMTGDALPDHSLEWEQRATDALPAGIQVYETTSELDGHAFRAWYAIADCKDDVCLRIQKPGQGRQRLSAQFTEDCFVLINGGYFDFNTSAHDGIIVTNGISEGRIYSQSGDWGGGPAKDYWYQVTRSIFGVDASGNPAFLWAGTSESGQNFWYNRPMASVRYEAQYAAPDMDCPGEAVGWTPQFAVSCGPMLLKNGYLLIGSDLDKDQYPVTDWEMYDWALASADYCRAQTAVGCTADGKIVLFACGLNGGYGAKSGGATLKQTAAILKSIGCIDAMKLDGGGSTGMYVCNGTDTSVSDRAVLSTIGFFRKQISD